MDELEKIRGMVLDELGISLTDFLSRCRKRKLVNARKWYCYLSRKLTKVTLEDIGKTVGYDHATVRHHFVDICNLISVDPNYQRKEWVFLSRVGIMPTKIKRMKTHLLDIGVPRYY